MGLYTQVRCPHCKTVLDHYRGMGIRSTIGPRLEHCKKCEGLYRTDKSEWREKSILQKLEYFALVAWLWFGGSFFVGGGGAFLILIAASIVGLSDFSLPIILASVFACTVGVLFAILGLRDAKKEIQESIRRQQVEFEGRQSRPIDSGHDFA